MRKVIVFGSGGLAKEVIGYIESDNKYEVACVVSTEYFNNPEYRHPVMRVAPDIDADYILAVADPEVKKAIVQKNADKWITYAHSSCYISPYATVGRGCVFAPQSLVCGDCIIEDFVFFNTNATVGHDSFIRRYVTLYPNAEVCGNCDIGEGVIFGIGAYAIPGVRMIKGSKASAGSVVRKSVLEPVTVYGDPAKPRTL